MKQSPESAFQDFLASQPLTERQYPALSRHLAATFGGNGFQLLTFSAVGRPVQSRIVGLSDKDIADYESYYSRINPRLNSELTRRNVVIDGMLFERNEFERTEFYSWYRKAARSREMMGFAILGSAGTVSMLCVGRHHSHGLFNKDHVANAERLHAALAANLRLTSAIEADLPFADLLLERGTQNRGLVILDAQFRIRTANPFFWQIFESSDLLSMVAGQLLLKHEPFRLIEKCERASDTGLPQTLMSGSADQCLFIEVVPMQTFTLHGPHKLLLLDIDPSRNPRLESRLTKMTAAERELCSLICNGRTLRDAADRRGVSYNTCRNQLASIHAKLETSSITDLVRIFGRYFA